VGLERHHLKTRRAGKGIGIERICVECHNTSAINLSECEKEATNTC